MEVQTLSLFPPLSPICNRVDDPQASGQPSPHLLRSPMEASEPRTAVGAAVPPSQRVSFSLSQPTFPSSTRLTLSHRVESYKNTPVVRHASSPTKIVPPPSDAPPHSFPSSALTPLLLFPNGFLPPSLFFTFFVQFDPSPCQWFATIIDLSGPPWPPLSAVPACPFFISILLSSKEENSWLFLRSAWFPPRGFPTVASFLLFPFRCCSAFSCLV